MAEAGPNVGFATLSIIPSLKGVEAAVAGQLAPVEAAAATSGKKAGTNMATALGGALKVGLLGATAAVVGVGAAAIASAKGVEDAQNIIIRATGATGKAAENLEQSFKNVAKTTPASFETVATALAEVSQRTGLSGDKLEGFTRQVVTFNRITKDSPVGVQELTKALAGFGIPADKLSSSFDQLFKTSQKTGVPLADLVATVTKAGPVFRQFGISASTTGGLLAQLDKAGIESGTAIAGLRAAFNKFAKAGIAPEEGLKKTLAAIQGLLKAGDEAGANKLAQAVFGGRGVGLVDAAKQGKLSLDALAQSFDQVGPGILDTAKNTGTVAGKFGILKNNLELALAPLGKPLLDAANAGLGAIVKLVQDAGTFIGPILRQIGDGFKFLIDSFKTGTQGAGGIAGFFQSVGVAARGLVDFFVTNWPKIKSAFLGAFEPVVAALKRAGPPILSLAQDGFKVLAGAAVILGAVFLKVLPTLGKIVGFFIDMLGVLAKDRVVLAVLVGPVLAVVAAMKIWALVTKIAAAAQTAFNLVVAANPIVLLAIAIGILVAGFILAYQKIKPVHDILHAIGTGLKVVFDFVVQHWKLLGAILLAPFLPFIGIAVVIIKNFSTLVDFFQGIVGFFARNWQLILALLLAPFLVPILLIRNNWSTLVTFFSGVGKAIVNAITGAFSAVVGFVSGVIESIVGFFAALPGRVIGFIQQAFGFWVTIIQTEFQVGIDLVKAGIDAVIGFFTALPGRVLGFILQVWDGWVNIVHTAMDIVKDLVGKGIDALVGFFGGLPGRIGGIALQVAVAAYNVGHSIITGIVNGISAAVGFVTDIGRAVAHAIATFINDHIINPFNSALEFTIALPFGAHFTVNPPDIPRLPTFAAGGIVPGTGPILAVVHGGEQIVPKGQAAASPTTINLFGSTVTAEDIFREARWAQLTGKVKTA